MARIVFGVGTSHSPLLATKPEEWDLRGKDDEENPRHYFRGKTYSFDELVSVRNDKDFAKEIAIEVRRERDAKNQKHLDTLGKRIKDADLDVLVIFGDDQYEILFSDNMPGFMIFNGAEVPFKPTPEERLAAMSPGMRVGQWANVPDHDMALPGASDLADHVVRCVVDDGFDVSVSDTIAERKDAEDGIGHAFGFYYHRLLDDLRDTPKLKTLPIFINTFFPPNQPRVGRVLEFGHAVGRAIRSWDSDARVGIAASGGLSHFVIDEALDRRLLDAIAKGDAKPLLAEPESHYQSGTSEIKNWIAAMGALEESRLSFRLLDYIPCYRSLAGTGNAMAFGLWE